MRFEAPVMGVAKSQIHDNPLHPHTTAYAPAKSKIPPAAAVPHSNFQFERRQSAKPTDKPHRLVAFAESFGFQRGLVATLKGRDCYTEPPSWGSAPPGGIPGLRG